LPSVISEDLTSVIGIQLLLLLLQGGGVSEIEACFGVWVWGIGASFLLCALLRSLRSSLLLH
jgi:hypothetical protein